MADLDAVVKPMQTLDQQDVPPAALEGLLGDQLRSEGFDAAAIVMLGGLGAGTNSGFWSRFVMLETVGVWAMEFMHSLTGFADLYPFGGNMGAFDEMAASSATHPSAYTKTAIDWLDPSAIVNHVGESASYELYSVGLTQPPPSGRAAAIRIGSQVPYLMVESRQRVDQFDANIPTEGVIVYRVQTSDPLGHAQNATAPIMLLTTSALTAGGEITSDTGIKVQVVSALPGGFVVSIDDPTNVHKTVPNVLGLLKDDAIAAMESVGLVLGSISLDNRCIDVTGTVLTQNPAAGPTMLAPGAHFDLTVSSGHDKKGKPCVYK
jgi:hypothetical protein